MNSYETIKVEQDARGVARLTLARPSEHNAINATMMRELRAAAALLAADVSVRVIVLAAEGKSFCAGGDLGWMREQAEANREARLASASEIAHMLRELDSLPKPLIACVQGAAYGGGVGLVSVCDVVVASDTASFALTEVKLGLIPATIGPYVIRRIGEGAARSLILNARSIDAVRAQALGLVTIVNTADALESAVESEIGEFLKCAPRAIAATKALCQQVAREPLEDLLSLTVEHLADRWETEEAREGIRSFFARQAPSWAPAKGRSK